MSLLPEIERELLRAARRPLTEEEQTDRGGGANRTDRRGSAASAVLTATLVLVALAFAGLLVVLLGHHRPRSTTAAAHRAWIYRDRAGLSIDVPPGWHVVRFRDSRGGATSAGAQISNVRLPAPALVPGDPFPVQVNERALPARGVGLIIATDSNPKPFGDVVKPPLTYPNGEPWAVGFAPGPPPYVKALWFRGNGKTFLASTAVGAKATSADRKALAGMIHSVRVQPTGHPAAARFPRAPLGGHVLYANGIGSIRFSEEAKTAIHRLDLLLGRRPSKPYNPDHACGIDDESIWPELNPSIPALVAYFSHGRFVGYAYWAARHQSTAVMATAKGLRPGDPLSEGRRLYGREFRVSPAQGGSWSTTTKTGPIFGYTSGNPKGPRPMARPVASIEAGDVGCPSMTP